MSTLRVDNIKGRTGSTVNIPDSNNLSVSGSLSVSGVTTFSSSAQLNLQGTNINSGNRGDILYYDSTGKLAKLAIGSAGSILKSDGNDVTWGGIGVAANVYYVATNGTDAAGSGTSADTAYRTIKYACANITTPTKTAPAVIFVKAGTYEEAQLPIIVPPYTTIVGDNLRATIIKPAAGLAADGSTLNNRSTLFRCSNGVIIQDLVCDGMTGYTPGNPTSDPTAATLGGVYFALNAQSPITDKSPYIYNVTSFGQGATGAICDGSLHSSGNRSMLFHTYTCIHSDGLGIWAKDNGNIESISGFTYYCTIGYSATGGSKIRSLNSSNAYGEYGVFSKGYDTSETPNSGTVQGTMLTYQGTITGGFSAGEEILGATSGATAYVINVQSEPKVLYITQRNGTFSSGEVVTGQTSGATATLVAGAVESNQSGRILVTSFATVPGEGDSLQFATTDGNAYQIQTTSTVVGGNSVTYRVLVFSTSRATPVPHGTDLVVRKEFSQVRLTGHDFLNVGTGGTDTTNWPDIPTQNKSQANQVVTLTTDPGRVYYVATDEDGNFYVGDQFKVNQATGQVTLDSSAFDLSGLQSLQLGSIGGLIGASVNEFSTDTLMSQNSNSKVPTQAAVVGYVGSVLSKDVQVGGALTVTGNLTVNGTTTTIDSVNLIVEDRNIGIGSTSSPSNATADGAGITIFAGADTDKTLIWDNGNNRMAFSTDLYVPRLFGSGANLTALNAANLTGALPAIDGSNLTGLSGGFEIFSQGYNTVGNVGSGSNMWAWNFTPTADWTKMIFGYSSSHRSSGSGYHYFTPYVKIGSGTDYGQNTCGVNYATGNNSWNQGFSGTILAHSGGGSSAGSPLTGSAGTNVQIRLLHEGNATANQAGDTGNDHNVWAMLFQ